MWFTNIIQNMTGIIAEMKPKDPQRFLVYALEQLVEERKQTSNPSLVKFDFLRDRKIPDEVIHTPSTDVAYYRRAFIGSASFSLF